MKQAIVQVGGPQPAAISPGELWEPVAGEETEAYLAKVLPDARERVRNEARAILARSVDPTARADARAGLVLGYVQSGKTTSMAACAAMARDNGIGLVVLIAGTSDILLRQSKRRFAKALGLEEDDAYRRWEHFESPRVAGQQPDLIAAAVRSWLQPQGIGDRPTILISIMKQASHLRHLAEVLHEVNRLVDLATIPALVFDDEADQASPNLRRTPGEESPTYRDLRRIRSEFPWHTLLQYTATPQALLLLGIADEISPEFTCVLEPGQDYVGGRYFFMERGRDFVRDIPQNDLGALDPDASEPPESLLLSLAVFVLGAVAARMAGTQRPTQRSMLIHPSQATIPHRNFVRWTRAALAEWDTVLQLDDTDPDRQGLVARLFEPAHRDLGNGGVKLPALAEVVAELPNFLPRIRVEEVNARGIVPVIDWPRAYAWILVGGTLMDRGFTVEGLTVTYMPRPVGVGNADTLQQRGRFFGYKRPYAEYCRAWLDRTVSDAFEAYVRHEESIRSQLIEETRLGRSLREWKRNFLLDRRLRPTRAAVVRLPFDRPQLAGWIIQDHLYAPGTTLNAENRTATERFLNSLDLRAETGIDPRRTDAQRHTTAKAKLLDVHRELLAPYAFYEGNSSDFTALQLLTGGVEEGEEAVVYLMSGGAIRGRELAPNSTRIINLMQGRNPTRGPIIYPGDREIHDPERLTVQVHWVDVLGPSREVVEGRVPALAVWVPDRLAADMLVQR